MKTYKVKEVFWTVQGEGMYAGTSAVFIRLAGCNMWSGREEDRIRDANRNCAQCPLFCDTDFVGGEKMTANELLEAVRSEGDASIIVITGGEPFLQIDVELLSVLQETFFPIHVETNGSICPDAEVIDLIDWVCVSPKQPPSEIKLHSCDELKVVYPAYEDPESYEGVIEATHRYIQPEDGDQIEESICRSVDWIRAHPEWNLSVQTHKLLGLR